MYWHRPQTGVLDFWCVSTSDIWEYLSLSLWNDGKILSVAKRREGNSITFCIVFYLVLPCRSLTPYSWSDYPDSSIFHFPQHACSFTCLDALWERKICHLHHTDAWIIAVIVLVMMMMMIMMIIIIITIIIIIIVTIILVYCAVSSVTWRIPIPIFMRLSSSHFCCKHFAICQTDRTATGLSYMSQ